jgi:hypothetical protein
LKKESTGGGWAGDMRELVVCREGGSRKDNGPPQDGVIFRGKCLCVAFLMIPSGAIHA